MSGYFQPHYLYLKLEKWNYVKEQYSCSKVPFFYFARIAKCTGFLQLGIISLIETCKNTRGEALVKSSKVTLLHVYVLDFIKKRMVRKTSKDITYTHTKLVPIHFPYFSSVHSNIHFHYMWYYHLQN